MSPDDAREAFRQGYVRGMCKAMSAIHLAFRKHWKAPRIEAMLRAMAEEADLEAREYGLLVEEREEDEKDVA